ncbi:hypothetical protein TNCV_3844741 [Trichonephila clavipes]|nr:hypothetical protein TNCV_3844741 [Trichonephila clavipes]
MLSAFIRRSLRSKSRVKQSFDPEASRHRNHHNTKKIVLSIETRKAREERSPIPNRSFYTPGMGHLNAPRHLSLVGQLRPINFARGCLNSFALHWCGRIMNGSSEFSCD